MKYQNELDCSDNWKGLKKLNKKQSDMIECKFGNYMRIGTGASGHLKLREMSEKEMAEIDSTDSDPCDCSICAARRMNWVEMTNNAMSDQLRSGKKVGWYKYGPGRTL